MIKYDKHSHSFSYDGDPSSSEMPSIEDVKRDKYGDVIVRMIVKLNNDLQSASFKCSKFYDRIEFEIAVIHEDGFYPALRSSSLKELFVKFTDVKATPFYKKSYHEVLVMLDLLETDEKDNYEHR